MSNGRKSADGDASSDPERTPTLDNVALGITPFVSPGEAVVAERIGRYHIDRRIGAGGMGVIYAAHDPALDRAVALKVVKASGNSARDARFEREAKALARLQHPNVVAVYDAGTTLAGLYIAMQLVDGGTLDEWLAEKPRTPRQILDVFVQAGRGLAAAHAAGIVHRDIKPSNILIDRSDSPFVSDFGIAHAELGTTIDDDSPEEPSASEVKLTRTGSIIGTPAYMAPEQMRGEPASPLADQFSFCVTLWQALYGSHPFIDPVAGYDRERVLALIEAGRPLKPAKVVRLPGRVERAIVRGLSAKPAERWPKMTALIDALAPRARRVVAIGGLAAAALTGGILTAVAVNRSEPDRCEHVGDGVSAVWSAEARPRLRSAISASGAPSADRVAALIEPIIDEYAGSWSAMRVEACRRNQGGEQSNDLYDRRMRCLDLRLAELDGMTTTLSEKPSPELVQRAVRAVSGLTPIAQCADVEMLLAREAPPVDPLERKNYDDVMTRIARAQSALTLMGKATDGGPAAALVAQARATGRAGPLAAASRVQMDSFIYTGDFKSAIAVARPAALDAARAGDDELTVRVLLGLARALAQLEKPADAQAVLDGAELIVARGGDKPYLRGLLDAQRGTMLYQMGRHLEASEVLGRAVATLEKLRGPDDLEVAIVVTNLANAVGDAGDYTRSEALYRRAIATLTAKAGPDHPMIPLNRSNLADTLKASGRLREALAEGTAALEERRRILRPGHPQIATNLDVLGQVSRRLGDLDAAERYARESLQIRQAAFGADSVWAMNSERLVAAIQVSRGDPAGRTALERLVERMRKVEDHTMLAFTLEELGGAYEQARDYRAAARVLGEAVELHTKSSVGDGVVLAAVRATHAEALRLAGDCPRAEVVAAEALGAFRSAKVRTHIRWPMAIVTLAECQRGRGALSAARETLAELPTLPVPAEAEKATYERGLALSRELSPP